MIEIKSGNIPQSGSFRAEEYLEGRNYGLDFYWIPLEEVRNIKLYPTNCAELLNKLNTGVQHFVYNNDC